ncbi:hypothetical protein CBS101457_006222 [Exobasidium rhododendri]|nr:hypothetical protein CBS101457_006222 [Exobasidium rhododendri]
MYAAKLAERHHNGSNEHSDIRRLTQRLLALCNCSQCEKPVNEPITLPCGHSSCLSCIVHATSESTQQSRSTILPCVSHLPPRLPLSSTTVPCPIAGCTRSAIGKGMGLWAGHSAFYGAEMDGKGLHLPPSEGNGPGSAPLDGFIVSQNQESNKLIVIPAQSRKSFAEKYAVSRYSLQGTSLADGVGLMRPDVTSAKAVDLLRRYGEVPSAIIDRHKASAMYKRDSTSSRRPRSRKTSSRQRLGQAVPSAALHHPAGTRTEINPHFYSALGVSEKGRHSGAIGGIRATTDSDEEEEDDDTDEGMMVEDDKKASRNWNQQEEQDSDLTPAESVQDAEEGEDDDEIGGAFARHYLPCSPDEGSEKTDSDDISVESKAVLSTGLAAPKISTVDQGLTFDTLHSELMDILECQLCYQLLYQPLTTPCGHTFCRQCFARSLDHSSACPLCRTEMPSFAFFQEHPSNVFLMNLLTAEWDSSSQEEEDQDPETTDLKYLPRSARDDSSIPSSSLSLKPLYNERKTTMEREARESLLSTPLFVCTLAFPHMPTILHIFEPRYRLMIRRCLESGNPRFGMVLPSQDMSGPVPGMARFGTMLEIKTVQMLPDGRSMIETVGSHRFRVLERGSIDGYTTGQIERIDDVSDEAEDYLERVSMGTVESNASPAVLAEAREAQAAFQAAVGIDLSRGEERQTNSLLSSTFTQLDTKQLVAVCTAFIGTLRSGSAPWLMTRLNNTYGPLPDESNVAAFGYWMALVMPIDEHEKSKLLPIRSPRLRLRIVVHWIEQLRQTWWFNHGCSVQ